MGNKNSSPDKTLDPTAISSNNNINNNNNFDKKSKRNKSFKKNKKDETDSPLKNGNPKVKNKNSKNSDDNNNNNDEMPSNYSNTIFRSPQNKPDNPGEKQLSKVILPEQELDIKVYKRSRDGLDTLDNRSQRIRSLPRSKSAALRKSTDTLLSSECRQRQQRYSSFAAPNGNNASFNSRWSSIVGNESPSDLEKPVGLQGVLFPAENVILTNRTTFEQSYVDCLVNQYYKTLPQVVQLSAIIIGYKRLTATNGCLNGENERTNVLYEPINLWQYFNCTQENWIPEDLVTPQASDWFISAIPVNLLTGLVHLRREGGNEVNVKEQLNLCIEIVRCISFEATRELSRIYEYQISVVPDQGSVQQLGRHAAERSVEYLRSGNRFVERDSLIEGVAYLPPDALSEELGGFVSAIFGTERELQWDIRRMYCCCGLRVFNVNDNYLVSSTAMGNDFLTPPNFYTSRECMPLVYGYRSVIRKRNIETREDVTSQVDLDLFLDLLDENFDDFHRDYIPLSEMKRLKMAIVETSDISEILRRNNNLNVNNYRYYGDHNQKQPYNPQQRFLQVPAHHHYPSKVVGRNCRQSTSTLIPENGITTYRHSLSNSVSNRSSILTNPNYNSLARSVEIGNGVEDMVSMGSQSFQRDGSNYKSERISGIGGGRLSKYVHGHPNRIPLNNDDVDKNSYAHHQNNATRQILARNQLQPTTNYNHSFNHSRPIETSFEYDGESELVVTNHRNGFTKYHSVCQTNLENNLNRMNVNRSTYDRPITNGVRQQHYSSVAKLPPKPPIRTISCSQYNSHPNILPNRNQSVPNSAIPSQRSYETMFQHLPPQQQHQHQQPTLSQQHLQQQQQHLQPQQQQLPQQQMIQQQKPSIQNQQTSLQQPMQQQQSMQQQPVQQQQQLQPVQQQQQQPSVQQQPQQQQNPLINREPDFLDFQSFLKLVEQQNNNLKSFEQKILLNSKQQQV